MTELSDLVTKVIQWGRDRNIVGGTEPRAQLIKTFEELGEIAGGEARGDREMIIDGIGDTLVTLILYAENHGISIEDALGVAWDEIKDRQGKVVDGVFVKESDLDEGGVTGSVE